MEKRIFVAACVGLGLLSATPATLAFSASNVLSIGLEPSSMVLFLCGVASVFAIRRLER